MRKTQCLAGAALAAAVVMTAAPAGAETLFKVVTVKDEIVIGLNDAELKELGGDAGGIARAIVSRGSLTVWQYGVTRKDGALVMAPRARVGLLTASSLRVEPYRQGYRIMAHD